MTIESHIKIYQAGPQVRLGFSVSRDGNPNELLGQPNTFLAMVVKPQGPQRMHLVWNSLNVTYLRLSVRCSWTVRGEAANLPLPLHSRPPTWHTFLRCQLCWKLPIRGSDLLCDLKPPLGDGEDGNPEPPLPHRHPGSRRLLLEAGTGLGAAVCFTTRTIYAHPLGAPGHSSTPVLHPLSQVLRTIEHPLTKVIALMGAGRKTAEERALLGKGRNA